MVASVLHPCGTHVCERKRPYVARKHARRMRTRARAHAGMLWHVHAHTYSDAGTKLQMPLRAHTSVYAPELAFVHMCTFTFTHACLHLRVLRQTYRLGTLAGTHSMRCMSKRVCTCVCASQNVCPHARMNLHVYTWEHSCKCLCVRVCVCVCIISVLFSHTQWCMRCMRA